MAPGLLRAVGWALGQDGPPEVVVAAGSATAQVVHRVPRPDVAEAHPGIAGVEASGWEAVIDLRGVRAPALDVVLLAREPAGGWRELDRRPIRLESLPRPAGRSRAAFTIVQDEPVFLPLWLSHYGRFFEPKDLYVLDHGTTDGSTSGLAGVCTVISVHRETSFDHAWLRSTVERFQSFLLQSYETVLFAEADELIVTDPDRHDGLDDYIEALREPAACCTGFNVVQQPSE